MTTQESTADCDRLSSLPAVTARAEGALRTATVTTFLRSAEQSLWCIGVPLRKLLPSTRERCQAR